MTAQATDRFTVRPEKYGRKFAVLLRDYDQADLPPLTPHGSMRIFRPTPARNWSSAWA